MEAIAGRGCLIVRRSRLTGLLSFTVNFALAGYRELTTQSVYGNHCKRGMYCSEALVNAQAYYRAIDHIKIVSPNNSVQCERESL